jgi:hypothetical protein
MVSRFTLLAACVLAFALLVAGAPALAKDGDGDRSEARVRGTCSTGATSTLRLRSRNGTIRAEFEVKRRRASEVWRVVLVHERRVAWRGTVRTHGSSGSFRVRRSLNDLDGPDEVVARASGPRGITCEASATLRG